MKKKVEVMLMCLITFLASFSLTGFVNDAVMAGKENEKIAALSYQDDSSAAGENVQGRYIVKAYDGRVCVYVDNDTTRPALETDIPVSGLRAYDRKLLNEGIVVSNYSNVIKLLEDFNL